MTTPRPNVAFFFAGANYRTAGDMVVGRQSASGGFLKGFIRHGGQRELIAYADDPNGLKEFEAFVRDTGSPLPARGYLPLSMAGLAAVGTLFRPGPGLGPLAWNRRHFDPRGFSLVGVTHTVADGFALDVLGELLVAPIEDWDALVSTSRSVEAVVRRVLGDWAEYLETRFGRRPALPRMPIIPLGVDAEAMAKRGGDAKARADLRARMNVADSDVALLYAERLDHVEKANPVPMLLAVEQAARATETKLHLIQAGEASSKQMETAFKQAATALAPSVNHHFIGGARTELYEGAWAAADVFLSLSDNIQEPFGLTPIEAMAAGLPCVVSDWNGYQESVIDGEQGFTVPTAMPAPGAGAELGYLFGSGFASYSVLVGGASQAKAVAPAAAAEAVGRLVADADLRRRLGDGGQARAAAVYDWRHVVAAHQGLWTELAEIREAAPEKAPRRDGAPAYPLRPDPFDAFRAHPTLALGGATTVRATGALDGKAVKTLMASELATPLAALLDRIAEAGATTVTALVSGETEERRVPTLMTLGWLAKMGFIRAEAGPDASPDGGDDDTLPFGKSLSWKRLAGS